MSSLRVLKLQKEEARRIVVVVVQVLAQQYKKKQVVLYVLSQPIISYVAVLIRLFALLVLQPLFLPIPCFRKHGGMGMK